MFIRQIIKLWFRLQNETTAYLVADKYRLIHEWMARAENKIEKNAEREEWMKRKQKKTTCNQFAWINWIWNVSYVRDITIVFTEKEKKHTHTQIIFMSSDWPSSILDINYGYGKRYI